MNEEETLLEELSQEDYDLKEIARTHGEVLVALKRDNKQLLIDSQV